jgi:hypothetical protein
MTDLIRLRIVAGVLTLLVIFTLFAGCARLKRGRAKTEKQAATETKTPEPLYYDFEDVLVPSELKLDKKKSFVYHAPGFTAGVLVLTGRVEMDSVIKFFENNMAKDNWQLLSVFKSPRTMMFFNKANRTCVINMTERQFRAEIEIWLAPIMEDEEAGLLK